MSDKKRKVDWTQSRWKRCKIAAAALLGKVVVHSLSLTVRMRAHPFTAIDPHRTAGVGVIFAVHHGAHFPILKAYKGQNICVITSLSADGEILTRVLASFGFSAARGSSSRGGMGAMKELAGVLKRGGDIAVAVDGPRGPAEVVKPGVILLAKRTGAPICPVGASIDRCWQVNSWDRYRIPKPFSRALVVGSAPIFVPPDADDAAIETLRVQLQEQLAAHQREVDEAVFDQEKAKVLIAQSL